MTNTIFILKQIRDKTVETQDLSVTIRYINDYIERLGGKP